MVLKHEKRVYLRVYIGLHKDNGRNVVSQLHKLAEMANLSVPLCLNV